MASFAKECLLHTIDKPMEEPWEGNKQYTNRQMLRYWLEKLSDREVQS
jgi:hypothetical protein